MSRAADLVALEHLLAGHREKLQRVIDIAHQDGRDRVTQRILDRLAHRARGYLSSMDLTLSRPVLHPTHGSLGLWGNNGLAPNIRDLLRSAEFHANYVPMEVKDLGGGRHRVAA